MGGIHTAPLDQPGHPAAASPSAAPVRRAVVVLGMHRSGTSLVAGCLQRLGVDFGPRLMPADPDNPRGYFEHNDVVNLHDRLLLALDRSWDETTPFPPDWWVDAGRLDPYRQQLLALLRRDFSTAPLWGIKDPRLCLLLPWWESVWSEISSRPLFVLVRRRPAEVAASLARREGMSEAKASLLWLRHTLEAERWSRGRERVLVNFDDFLADETAALAPVRRALGLTSTGEAEPVRSVDPALGRSGAASLAHDAFLWVTQADDALLAGQGGDETGMRATLDDLAGQLGAGESLLVRSSPGEVNDLLNQLATSRKQARWYEEEWQKASARAEKLKEQRDRSKTLVREPGETVFSARESSSIMIKCELSLLRNSLALVRIFLARCGLIRNRKIQK